MTIKVECKFVIDVEVEYDYATGVEFMIEENGCPGTGLVGAALMDAIEKHEEAGTCWACALQGANKILAIDGRPVTQS